MTNIDLTVQRVRHTLKRRTVQVRRTERITPQLLAVTFGGEDLHDFVSASFDDHVKLCFPAPGESLPNWPDPDAQNANAHAPRPIMRDYTPRRYDPVTGELEIQFVLHGDGPAASWAAQAKPGDYLGIGGPRGSFVIPTGFDWFLMIGDETALPAIGRRLEELPAGTRVTVVVEIDADAQTVDFQTQADADIIWARRRGRTDTLETAVRRLAIPEGEGYVWAAGEGHAMRAIHQYLLSERGLDKSRVRASSYWKHGAVAVHESHGD